jgi:hypothetical protein
MTDRVNRTMLSSGEGSMAKKSRPNGCMVEILWHGQESRQKRGGKSGANNI